MKRYGLSDVEIFPKAPIVEAIIGFEMGYLDDLVSSAKSFHSQIANRYPSIEFQQENRTRSVSGPEPGSSGSSAEPSGVLFRSEDELWAVHLTRRFFNVHRLKPYEGWESFKAEAETLWKFFQDCFDPETVTRINLRYLNRIDLPLRFHDFSEYFRTYLELAPAIDTGLSSFLLRFALNDPAISADALVTLTFEPATTGESTIPVVFDIDVFRRGDFGLGAEAIWGTASQLREYKDRIFFESLTEKAKELFR